MDQAFARVVREAVALGSVADVGEGDECVLPRPIRGRPECDSRSNAHDAARKQQPMRARDRRNARGEQPERRIAELHVQH